MTEGCGSGFRPLSEFIAELDARGVAEQGWLRWRLARMRARVSIRWWRLWNNRPHVSQEAFDAVSLETLAAIATEAGTAATEGAVHEGAGPKDIAK